MFEAHVIKHPTPSKQILTYTKPIVLQQQGTRLAGIRDVQVTSFRICDGLELVVDCAVPESVAGQAAESRKALVSAASVGFGG